MEAKTKPVIQPTIGRRVLLFLASATPNDPKVPYDAGIAYVWGDSDPVRNTINVGYRDHGGVAHSHTSVVLYDRPQSEDDAHNKGETYAVWMPYQFEQALRALQPKVGAGPAAARPADIALTALENNGVLTDAGRQKLNNELREQDRQEREQSQDDTARAVGEAS